MRIKGNKQKGKINVMKKENKKKTKTKQKKMWKKKRKQKYPHGDSNLHYDYLLCESTAPSWPIGYAGTE